MGTGRPERRGDQIDSGNAAVSGVAEAIEASSLLRTAPLRLSVTVLLPSVEIGARESRKSHAKRT